MTAVAAGRRRATVPGSFARSMLVATARGAGLVGAAVLIGLLLLQVTDDSPVPTDTGVIAGGTTTTTTTTSPEGTEPGVRPPGQVAVLVLNGARISGIAARTTDLIAGLGYQTLPAGDAPKHTETVVYSRPGYEDEAEVVAQAVAEAVSVASGYRLAELTDPPQFPGAEAAHVVVVLGAP